MSNEKYGLKRLVHAAASSTTAPGNPQMFGYLGESTAILKATVWPELVEMTKHITANVNFMQQSVTLVNGATIKLFSAELNTHWRGLSFNLMVIDEVLYPPTDGKENDMKRHIGTKIVLLSAMTRLEYNEYRGWKLPDDENGAKLGYLVEYTDGGEPNDSRHDGYISWSPKEQADNAYRPTEGMPFGLAVEALKKGHQVARSGWNGKGMYVLLMDGAPEGVSASPEAAEKHRIPSGFTLKIAPFLAIMTAQGTVSTWAPSVNDALADDWAIV